MITRRLLVNLNDADILDRGQKLANAEHDYAAIEDAKKTANDGFKKSLEATGSRIADLSAAIRDRMEIQDVECSIVDDDYTMKHIVTRLDTREIVETYDFTDAEKQKRLFTGSL